MRAVVVDRWMEPSELTVGEGPEPGLLPGRLQVEVRAAGCNFFDILMVTIGPSATFRFLLRVSRVQTMADVASTSPTLRPVA